ncbi:MAG: metallophosphoesterase [Alistipes sp.]|nr:metallophosphoesterase [Alistipes sp.]
MKKLTIIFMMLCVAFTTRAAEFLYGPYVQAITEDSAYIVWVTDKATYGWVEVKAEGEKKPQTYIESNLGLKYNRRVHRVPVKGLKAGTLYEYEIFMQQDEKGGKLTKPVSLEKNRYGNKFTFRTNDRNKEEISFMITADTHYNPTLFSELYTLERIKDKDFVMFDGDMVTTFSNEKSHFDKLFNKIQETFEHNNTQFYFVRGNHDARGNHARYFLDYYPTWTNMPYFAFRHGPVFFLAIDGGEDKPDSDIEYSGTAAFDLYRSEQGKWLESVLESEEFKTATYRIIVSHIPLNENSWHGGRHAWQHLSHRCEDKGVNIMVSGHLHRYRYIKEGTHHRTFPTLIIGADKYLDAVANKEALTIKIINKDGSLHKTFTFPAQQK